jgi:uncharacterized protein (DUF2236 family)
MPGLRTAIQRTIGELVGVTPGSARAPAVALEGDAGLFGPDSACWKVNGDFTSMMIGGVAALLVQMLHPRALAGIWDHSNFREDRYGRLGRTARFVAATTYGTTEQALAQIAKVRGIHDRVVGVTADGQPYSANEPELLTWIHVAEVSSFLAAYQRHRDPMFPGAEQDRYYAETATIAEALGATGVPRDRAGIEAYLRAVRPQLRFDDRTREISQALLAPPTTSATRAFAPLIFRASKDLLPDWARRMHGLPPRDLAEPAVRLGVAGLGGVLRWGHSNGAEARARQRTRLSTALPGSRVRPTGPWP